MIQGTVSGDRAALVWLRLRGPAGVEQTVPAVVDTGFSASLTLPDAVITALGLNWHSVGVGQLATGAEIDYDVFESEIDWGGWRTVLVSAVGGPALLGMRLLLGHELRVAVEPGGAVEGTPLA